MEIIKEGKDINTIMYKFICDECECEFIASKGEMSEEGTYTCPNCGTVCSGVKI